MQKHAKFTCDKINSIPGLKAIVPSGAMYVMVAIEIEKFKDIKSDTEFCEKLVGEKSVFCLPGKVCLSPLSPFFSFFFLLKVVFLLVLPIIRLKCFQYPNYFRIVFTPPIDRLEEACSRLADFCKDHLA